MSKDFMTARYELQEALRKQRLLLAEERHQLELFRQTYESLDENSPASAGFILDALIVEATKKVESIEAEIRGTKRLLEKQYSLAPAM